MRFLLERLQFYNYQQNLLNLTIGNIDAWQPMEYDLWIDPSSDYYNQIIYDINFYLRNEIAYTNKNDLFSGFNNYKNKTNC